MDTLDYSPLEALALNYLTAVNNMWAWVAVITTAAVSLWSLKAALSSSSVPLTVSRSEIMKNIQDDDDASLSSSSSHATVVSSLHHPAGGEGTNYTTAFRVLEREENSKVKISLYYNEDSTFGNGGEDRELGYDWERKMVVRMGDHMGWYKYQDLTLLNGSVVRLWDSRHTAAEMVVDGGGAW